MIAEAVKTAHKHAAQAAGLLSLMYVSERANLGRLREIQRALREATAQVEAAIVAVERKLGDAHT